MYGWEAPLPEWGQNTISGFGFGSMSFATGTFDYSSTSVARQSWVPRGFYTIAVKHADFRTSGSLKKNRK